ncbi:SIS domain-containing protein [Erwinia sp. CPCC 100877]|nr:SIS domain-containing protein [Erwinia sp. CPCC 100877]
MKFQQIIQKNTRLLSETDKTICSYICAHQKQIPELSITKLAEASYTSKSSVLRFVQKIGFKGYSEFKHLIDWNTEVQATQELLSLNELTTYITNILNAIQEQTLTGFFELLRNAPKIYLLATGTDQQIQAQNFARSFLKMNVVCTLIPSNSNIELASIVLDNAEKKDLIIVFSGSGSNSQINELLTVPLIKKVPVVSLTINDKSWLKEQSSYHFSVSTKNDELLPFFASGICHLMIDFLAAKFQLYVETLLAGK